MYIIHSKAKFIVIEIIKPIIRNAKISNIKPHPLTLDKKSRSRATTHLLILLSMSIFYIIFCKKSTLFAKIFHSILSSLIYKVLYLLGIYLQTELKNFLFLFANIVLALLALQQVFLLLLHLILLQVLQIHFLDLFLYHHYFFFEVQIFYFFEPYPIVLVILYLQNYFFLHNLPKSPFSILFFHHYIMCFRFFHFFKSHFFI